jgi:hypothetical protein
MAQRYNIVLKSVDEKLAAEKGTEFDSLKAGDHDTAKPNQHQVVR